MESAEHKFDMIEELLASPLKLADFQPMKREEVHERSGSPNLYGAFAISDVRQVPRRKEFQAQVRLASPERKR
jgi:hypothetical protein